MMLRLPEVSVGILRCGPEVGVENGGITQHAHMTILNALYSLTYLMYDATSYLSTLQVAPDCDAQQCKCNSHYQPAPFHCLHQQP